MQTDIMELTLPYHNFMNAPKSNLVQGMQVRTAMCRKILINIGRDQNICLTTISKKNNFESCSL